MVYLSKKLIIILAVFSMASFLQARDIDSNPPRKADNELFWSSMMLVGAVGAVIVLGVLRYLFGWVGMWIEERLNYSDPHSSISWAIVYSRLLS